MKLAGGRPVFLMDTGRWRGRRGRLSAGYDSGSSDTEFLLPSGDGDIRIRNIVLHYTANPGATAKQNRDYFEGLKDTHLTKASSHFIVGLDGEIVQCIPTWEVAYASNNRNGDTVSIECCHPDESGLSIRKHMIPW